MDQSCRCAKPLEQEFWQSHFSALVKGNKVEHEDWLLLEAESSQLHMAMDAGQVGL